MTLLLEQPYGGMGAINPTGHSAIYLDHVCAETPVQLRACRPGELGTVISRYDGIAGRDWMAIPLLPYLYAVEQPEEIPETVDPLTVSRLRNLYRRAHLTSLVPDEPGGEPPAGNWYELIGSAFDRTIFGFQVKSTPEQDERVMALLNDRRNVERYNGMFRNCADFTRVMLNRFYPHAVRRNLIADLGLSTPKSVARGLTRYAAKHPEAGLQVFEIPQVRGSLPRSHHTQGVAESLVKKYGVPLTLMSPIATGVVFVAYLGRGRFTEPRDAPILDLTLSAKVKGLVAGQGASPDTVQTAFRTEPAVVLREIRASDAQHAVRSPALAAPEPLLTSPVLLAAPAAWGDSTSSGTPYFP